MSNQTKLQKLWYKKLKNEGFNDIEHGSGFLDRSYTKSNRTPLEIEVIQHYYSLAHQLLNNHKFEDKIEQIIWEYHTEGLSAREIANILVQLGIKKKKHVTVHKTIKKLENIMKERYLTTDV